MPSLSLGHNTQVIPHVLPCMLNTLHILDTDPCGQPKYGMHFILQYILDAQQSIRIIDMPITGWFVQAYGATVYT